MLQFPFILTSSLHGNTLRKGVSSVGTFQDRMSNDRQNYSSYKDRKLCDFLLTIALSAPSPRVFSRRDLGRIEMLSPAVAEHLPSDWGMIHLHFDQPIHSWKYGTSVLDWVDHVDKIVPRIVVPSNRGEIPLAGTAATMFLSFIQVAKSNLRLFKARAVVRFAFSNGPSDSDSSHNIL